MNPMGSWPTHSPSPLTTITPATLAEGIAVLTQRDPVLAQVYGCVQTPPLWLRPPGLATLVHMILEQQVSLRAAQATFARLQAECDPLSPASLLRLTPDQWRACGVSRQKSDYLRHLATALAENRLDLPALTTLDDATVVQKLTQIRGIGVWTANIYLLMALGRADVWPTGDLALRMSIQTLYPRPEQWSAKALQHLSRSWQPWRSVAARLLWQYYLQCIRRDGSMAPNSGSPIPALYNCTPPKVDI